MQAGPCLPWCSKPPLAQGACAVFFLTSVYYVAIVRGAGIASPLRDSLTTRQLEILAASKAVRRRVFLQALGLAVLTTLALRRRAGVRMRRPGDS